MDKKGDLSEVFKTIFWIIVFTLLLTGIYLLVRRFT
jgi:uncharacterized protein (UPF0333 family)